MQYNFTLMQIAKYRVEFFSSRGNASSVRHVVICDTFIEVRRKVFLFRQPSFNWCFGFRLFDNRTGKFIRMLTDKDDNMTDLLKCFPEKITIHAIWSSNAVLIDDQLVNIEPSRKLSNHSAEFAWGYPGSGSAQLALAILLKYVDAPNALRYYQTFKDVVIANLPNATIYMTIDLKNKMAQVLYLVDGIGQPELFNQ